MKILRENFKTFRSCNRKFQQNWSNNDLCIYIFCYKFVVLYDHGHMGKLEMTNNVHLLYSHAEDRQQVLTHNFYLKI
jgi:hypothetical protein